MIHTGVDVAGLAGAYYTDGFGTPLFSIMSVFQTFLYPVPTLMGLFALSCCPARASRHKIVDPPGARLRRWSDKFVNLFRIGFLDEWCVQCICVARRASEWCYAE